MLWAFFLKENISVNLTTKEGIKGRGGSYEKTHAEYGVWNLGDLKSEEYVDRSESFFGQSKESTLPT